jgi:hypothetical protein
MKYSIILFIPEFRTCRKRITSTQSPKHLSAHSKSFPIHPLSKIVQSTYRYQNF